MSTKFHIIYLHPEIDTDKWAHLHRFLNPHSRKHLGWKSCFCANLEASSFGPYLKCLAKDFSGSGAKIVHLPQILVSSIIELPSHKNPIGFLNPEDFPDPPDDI